MRRWGVGVGTVCLPDRPRTDRPQERRHFKPHPCGHLRLGNSHNSYADSAGRTLTAKIMRGPQGIRRFQVNRCLSLGEDNERPFFHGGLHLSPEMRPGVTPGNPVIADARVSARKEANAAVSCCRQLHARTAPITTFLDFFTFSGRVARHRIGRCRFTRREKGDG